jgi:hypothetical protein
MALPSGLDDDANDRWFVHNPPVGLRGLTNEA